MITKKDICSNNNNIDCQCNPKCPCVPIYDTIELAIEAANNVQLHPGKTYMTYYKDADIYGKTRCIIAVGNATPGQRHVIFDNTINYESIDNIKKQISDIEEEIIDLKLVDSSLTNAIQNINNSYIKMNYTLIDPSTGQDIYKSMNILVKNN